MLLHETKLINRRLKRVKKGSGVINTLINKLPFELHIPGYQYCGPGTKLAKRLARGDPGINKLDQSCREHDIAYNQSSNLEDRHKADYRLEQQAWERVKSKDASLGEKSAAWAITNTMKAKRKLGMGLNKKPKGRKRRQKRIIPIPKQGGFLPLLLPILGALGALGGGAAGIAKAVNDAKASNQQLAEQQRHNLAMEKATTGKGLRFHRNKKRERYICRPLYKKMLIPHRALTNVDLEKFAKKLNLQHFRGVFMKDNLPSKIRKTECGIVNMDISSGPGNRWTAYVKKNNNIIYFDSYGNLRPPNALIKYFLSDNINNTIQYNHHKFQKDNTVIPIFALRTMNQETNLYLAQKNSKIYLR
ncbi:hypothetical protein NQ315_009052 [Exocentrus adspersus]|uniref:Phospholipase A2-like domain-containing protein n=1 Tax=Exocentrus adspersus TaxID=1586481 RepID=A0AAV8VDM5_9CUCU|nr:hypothetical protein NQ315_009052 [Exocentrus adspersus]